jgi:hypothetical protein
MRKLLSKLVRPVFAESLSRIQAVRNIHAGESCYLLGDGVSIKWFDLGAFSDRKAMPCGFIPLHQEFDKLDVSTLILMEPWWFYPWQRTTSPPVKFVRNRLQQMYRRKVLETYPEKHLVTSISNMPVLGSRKALYTYRDIEDSHLPEDFISRKFNCFAGSLRASILLAIYMGFESCFLVGFDYTHYPSKSRHWYERGEGIENGFLRHDYDFLSEARRHISLTTVTVEASSQTLDSITYRELTGDDPVYRENTALVRSEDLKTFSSWPGYTIF